MAVLIPDNSKKHHQFIRASAMNLVFMIILALYLRSVIQPGFGLVGLLLAIAWKPLSRGVIVLLALHYILMMSIVLLAGYADVTLLLGQEGARPSDIFILLGILAALILLFIFNLKSLKDLDLPSIFGKR